MNYKLGKNHFKDDDNFDEAIPIQIRKQRTTEAYRDNTNEDIETIDKNENSKQIVQKLNGDQYMRLQMKIISKILIYFRMILSQNVNNAQTNHKTYRVM